MEAQAMPNDDHRPDDAIIAPAADYDVVIVGASLAGCATAMLLGRAGARVALVEKQPDPAAFKRICSHFIQSSAVPALEHLGLLRDIEEAGGVRSGLRAWTRWGWIQGPPLPEALGVNLRREKLDPLVRGRAAETTGVELLLGHSAERVLRGPDGAVRGVVARTRDGSERELRGHLVVGADGRDSHVAKLAGVRERTSPHNRFAYGAYFEGPPPAGAPAASIWLLDPDWAAAFPTDDGQTFYAAMPTKARLEEFKRDPAAALMEFVGSVPDAPPIRESRLVDGPLGKLDMTNRLRDVTAPGLALVGDAALAIDPLWGVGCGWAFQSAEWLADAVAPALLRGEALDDGLQHYRRRHARGLNGHARLMVDFATGRKLNRGEQLVFSATTRDAVLARRFDEFGSRRVGPARSFATTIPRALYVNARHALRERRGGGSQSGERTAEAVEA
jgi:menaquinone-9 beta-reductase